jgi:hypothetical protein
VERLKQQGAEDEQVQRALRKIDRSRRHLVPFPYYFYRKIRQLL